MQWTAWPEFVDPTGELQHLTELLKDARVHIVVIEGEPGTGKTTLARTFLAQSDARSVYVSLRAETRMQSVSLDWDVRHHLELPVLDEAALAAARESEYVVIDEVRSSDLPDVLRFVRECSRQRFILISPEVLELPDASRIVLRPLASDAMRNLVEKWTQTLRIPSDPNLLQQFLDRFATAEATPRSVLDALDALREAGGFAAGLEALQPFKSPGLVGLDGNPLSAKAPQFAGLTSRIEVVNSRLLDDVRRDPNVMYALDPREFEFLVADLLSEQGFDVDVTPRSGDGGVDIWIAEDRTIGSFKYMVECKRYAPSHKVGVKVIREVFGTLQASDATAALVVTSSYFTKGAQSFAEQQRYKLNLHDYLVVRRWLDGDGTAPAG